MIQLILYNGRFFTQDPDQKQPVTAAAIEADRIAALGTDADILALAGPDTSRIDLQGSAVYPGMTDSHLHILSKANSMDQMDLTVFHSTRELLDAICKKASELPEKTPIYGRGFNEDLWESPVLPTADELDEAAPGHPIILKRICGHLAIASHAAIESAGITSSTPVPDGGTMDLHTGIFTENALDLLKTDAPDDNVERAKMLLMRGMALAADAGLTCLHTDDFSSTNLTIHAIVEAYHQLTAEDRMPVRIIEQCDLSSHEALQAFLDAGYRYGQGDDYFRFGPRKLYADGSLGARTGWMTQPYIGQPENFGVPVYTQEEMNARFLDSHRAGMPSIVHAIGDAAADCVLNAIENARRELPETASLRDGIVHCQITRADTLKRIAAMNIDVYAQPIFVEYDLHICRDRVGETLEQTSYAWKSLMDAGVCVSSGSDCPVEPLDPVKNIYCAVTRKDLKHQPEEGWTPHERLSVEEAIAAHTVLAAQTARTEDRLGMLRPGYLADFSIFSEAFQDADPDDILKIRPVMTIVGGKVRLCGNQ